MFEAGEALLGHVVELRRTLLGVEGECDSLPSRLSSLQHIEEDDELTREAKTFQKRLESMAGLARSEREAEREAVSKINNLIRESFEELQQTDGQLCDEADRQLCRLDEVIDDQSEVSPRVALATATRHLRRAIDLHVQARAAQDRKLNALAETLREEVDQARNQASRDALTGVLNRGAFERELERGLRIVISGLAQLGFILLDIDHFKQVNDTYGHPAGDEVLKHVADLLVRTCLRRDDVVARYGGEEFAIILRDISRRDLVNTAERLRRQLASSPVTLKDEEIIITISLGVDVITAEDDRDSLLTRVDAALYDAKACGRNCVRAALAPTRDEDTSHRPSASR